MSEDQKCSKCGLEFKVGETYAIRGTQHYHPFCAPPELAPYDRDVVKRLDQQLEQEAQGNNRFRGWKLSKDQEGE